MTRPQKQPISKSNRVWEIERQKLSLCRSHGHKYNHSPVSLACTVWLPHTPSPITSMVYSYTRKFGSIPEVITDRHTVWFNWLTQLIVGFRNNSPSSGTHRLLHNCPLAPAGQDTLTDNHCHSFHSQSATQTNRLHLKWWRPSVCLPTTNSRHISLSSVAFQ